MAPLAWAICRRSMPFADAVATRCERLQKLLLPARRAARSLLCADARARQLAQRREERREGVVSNLDTDPPTMLRYIIPAAAAAALVAAPACAGSIRISTDGKTAREVKAEIVAAAVRLCAPESAGSAVAAQLQDRCVRDTVRSAAVQSSDPSVLKLARR
jgi:hypothetical protein